LGMYREWKKTEFPKGYYIRIWEQQEWEVRPRSRWQDEVRGDVRIVGAERWHEKLYNREGWKKLLRTARNCRILHMPVDRMNEATEI
jgi:hypothetical protein